MRLPNDDLGDDEELSQGFYTEEEPTEEESLDPRDNLPESLEYLYLEVAHEIEEWKRLVEILEVTNANTPKLTLDNTCIKRGKWSYGRAVEPEVRFATPHLDDIWRGYSYLH